MTGRGLRIALAGATGALGDEVVAVLSERRFPLASFFPFATDRSLGEEIEIGDNLYPVADALTSFRDLDLLIVCTPPDAARELVRAALRASLPCIDCSGSMLGEASVPVALPDLEGVAAAVGAPLCSLPPGPAVGWAYALGPLHQATRIASVNAVALQGVAHAGAAGMEILSEQTVAVLNSQEGAEQSLLPGTVAFDALPFVGELPSAGLEGSTGGERLAALGLQRILGGDFPVAVTAVRVPTFVGDGTALQVSFERPLGAVDAAKLLAKAPDVRLWDRSEIGPSLRDAARSDQVHVARLRPDPANACGLLMWTSSDSLRLCAASAVRLAELRLTLN